jgi:dinuclear metal center YbgI/SA1388 family protein
MKVKVKDIAAALETIAPARLAEEWDNVGLLVGDAEATVQRLMLCIDLTEAVLDEAIAAKAQMVMAYHPVIFKSIRRLTASSSPVLWRAARANLAIYSMHTAWDSTTGGTNDTLAALLGLADVRPLVAHRRSDTCKVTVFAQPENMPAVAEAAWEAGAGHIGRYDRCGFVVDGEGTFRPQADARPTVGRAGQQEWTPEQRMEFTVPAGRLAHVCRAIRAAHSYEEPVIDVAPMTLCEDGTGMGRVGRLAGPAKLEALLRRIKRALGVRRLLVARPLDYPAPGRDAVERVAVSAGSAGGMWRDALAAGAQLYLTGEMRHHDALAAAAAGMVVVCVGHSNSERPTLGALAERLGETLDQLEIIPSDSDRDPFEIV